jgi:hypothetical protein
MVRVAAPTPRRVEERSESLRVTYELEPPCDVVGEETR